MTGGVLVVDDGAETRALTAEMLAGEGIAVWMATTGEEALAMFARQQPTCVLLDIGLPGLDGIAVCERIRAQAGGERVAIVFITARRDVEAFDRALRAGGDDFLTKPFRPGELVVRIQTARRLRAMAAERNTLTLELKHQRDELQRLQLQKEQLTEFLVHDLKNPVNSIDLLSRRADRIIGKKIREESRALMRMITNLLDVNRAHEGQLVPARRIVEVHALVADALAELETRASAANVALVTSVHVETAHVDRDLVLRVITNLLENAVRHAPEGTAIKVTAQRGANGLELRVSDAGPGVPLELRATVFERFVTAGPLAKTGLGLAFCRVAVAAHGGRIWVEDGTPGAVFCVEIPDDAR
ncbi:MAG TPA: response regulator [Kofleriaceae bacterium]|jgi:signal transduction histidine kinase